MMLSEHIKQAQELLAEHGDLEMLESYAYRAVSGVSLLEVTRDNDFPKDWNMPAGTKVAIVDVDA